MNRMAALSAVTFSLALAAKAEDFDRGRRMQSQAAPPVGASAPAPLRLDISVMRSLVAALLRRPAEVDGRQERLSTRRKLNVVFEGDYYEVVWDRDESDDCPSGPNRPMILYNHGSSPGSKTLWWVTLEENGTVKELSVRLHPKAEEASVMYPDHRSSALAQQLYKVIAALVDDDH